MSNPPPPATPDTDGEIQINLRQLASYLDPIFRQWELLLTIVLVVAIATVLSTLNNPTIYRASVVIATTRLLSDVSFGSAIRTVSESGLPLEGAGAQSANRAQRLQTFVALVNDASIAQSVYDQVAAEFDPDAGITAARLAGAVEGSLVEDSDGIRIDVRYDDPDLAARIANLWGEAYVRHINTIYSSGGVTASLETVSSETVRAKREYDAAQQAFVDFVTNNQIDELNRQIAEKQAIVTALGSARQTAVDTIITTRIGRDKEVIAKIYDTQLKNQLVALDNDLGLRREIFGQYVTSLLSMRKAAVEGQVNDRVAEWNRAWSELSRTRAQLETAQTMQAEVQQGGAAAAASNSLALVLFKAQVYVPGGTGSIALQQLPDGIAEPIQADAMLRELAALIETLDQRKNDLETRIEILADELQRGEGLDYLNVPLNDTSGELAKLIEDRYPELFELGQLSELSLETLGVTDELEADARKRSEDLLALKGLEDVLSFSALDTPLGSQIQTLQQEIRDLQALVSQQGDQRKELERARDLAWNAYTTLATKQTELSIASQTTGAEVALGGRALPPPLPEVSATVNLLRTVAITLLLGIAFVYLVEFWAWYREKPAPTFLRVVTPRFEQWQARRQATGTGKSS